METSVRHRDHLTKHQFDTAKWLAGVATSPVSPDYLPAHFVPNPMDGIELSDKDFTLVAELATNHVLGVCIMYLPQTKTFYFQRIPACFRTVPIGKHASAASN